MTESEIKIFRDKFASIVYWKGMVKSAAADIGRLESWNKGGSHDKAILKACDILKEYKSKLRDKLEGKTYEEWRSFSKGLSLLNNNRNRSVNDATKRKWQSEIDNLTWK